MCLPTLADGGAGGAGGARDINTNPKEAVSDIEGMGIHSSVMEVWMSSPEKNVPSQHNVSHEAKTSQSVVLDQVSL